MVDLKAVIEILLKTQSNSVNDAAVKKSLNDLKIALTNTETKIKIKELLPSIIPSFVSSIGLSETATETSLTLITYILSNNLTDDNIFKTLEDVLDKVCSLLPFLQSNTNNIFLQAVDCLLALPKENFTNLSIKHYTTLHKRINQSLNKVEENATILKVMLQLAKCSENDKPLLIDHLVSDGGILQKLISILFGTDKECRKIAIEIIMTITSRDVSFTTITTSHIASLKHGLKENYMKVMTSLYKSNDEHWSHVWCCVVRLLGCELHDGPTYVNVLLEILEEAFKYPIPNVRFLAFQCWQELIFNFALNTLELCSKKRMKLLLLPLKANNCKVERVAFEKFKTWWLLIRKIQQHIHMFIGDALISFLNYCFQPVDFAGPNAKKEECLSHGKRFTNITQCVIHGLLEILGHKNANCTCIQIDVDKLMKPIISTEIFVACSQNIISAVKEASTLLVTVSKFTSDQQRKIVECLWAAIIRITDENRQTINEEIILCATFVIDFYLSKDADHLAAIILEEIVLAHDKLFLHIENKILFTHNMADKKKLIFSIEKEIVMKNMLKIIFDSCHDCEEIIKNIFFNIEFLSTIENHQLLCNFWTRLGIFLITIDESKQSIFFNSYLKTPVELLIKNSSSDSHVITIWCDMYKTIFNDLLFPQDVLIDLCIFLEHIQNENDTIMPLSGILIGQVLNCCIPQLKVMSVPNMCVKKILRLLTNLASIQTLNKNNCMVFDTLTKMLKIFYINYGAISLIFKSLSSFFKFILSVNKNNYTDLLDILKEIGQIVTKVITDHSLLNLVLNSLKLVEQCNDNEVNLEVDKLTKMCKEKLKGKELPSDNNVNKDNNSVPKEKENPQVNEQNKHEEILGHDIDKMVPVPKRTSILNRLNQKNETPKNNTKPDSEDLFMVSSSWRFDPEMITEKQKEKMKERGRDIPALYEDLSQSNSQDDFKLPDKENKKTSMDYTTELKVPPLYLTNLKKSKDKASTIPKQNQKAKKNTTGNQRVKRNVYQIRNNIPHITGDSVFDNALNTSSAIPPEPINITANNTEENKDTTQPLDNEIAKSNDQSKIIQEQQVLDQPSETKSDNSAEEETAVEVTDTSNIVVKESSQKENSLENTVSDSLIDSNEDDQDKEIANASENDQLNVSQDYEKLTKSQEVDSDSNQRRRITTRRRSSPLPLTKTEREMRKLKIECNDKFEISSAETKPTRTLRTREPKVVNKVLKGVKTRRSSVNTSTPDAKQTKSGRGRRKRVCSIEFIKDDDIEDSEELIQSSQELESKSKLKFPFKFSRTNSSNNMLEQNLNQTEKLSEQKIENSQTSIETEKETDTNNSEPIQENKLPENQKNSVISKSNEKETDQIANKDKISQTIEYVISQQDIIPSTAEALLLKDNQQPNQKDDSIYEKDTESIGDDIQGILDNCNNADKQNTSFIEYKDTDNSIVTAGILSSPKKNEELTKEFLNSTIDISPIKVEEKQTITNESSKSSSDESFNTSNNKEIESIRSPEVLFGSEKNENSDKLSPNQEPSSESMIVTPKSPKRRRVRGQGRSAHLLELIPNVKPVDVLDSENATNVIRERRLKQDKSSSQDLLEFEKTLPSPLAKPATGIIKGVKRKQSPVQDFDSPQSKRKRVSFHDPPVSSEKRYVPENFRNVQISKIRGQSIKRRQKSRLFEAVSLFSNTTGKTNSPTKSLNKRNSPKKNQNTENLEPNNSLLNGISDSSSPTEKDNSKPTDIKTLQHSSNPFYKKLSTCQNSIDHIIYDLVSPLWISSLREAFNSKNIKTVGDFASLSEQEINNLPIKEDKVENSRNILDRYLQRLERENNVNLSESPPYRMDHSSISRRYRRHSLSTSLEYPIETSIESKVEQIEKIFSSCNDQETSQLLQRIISMVGNKDSDIVIDAVNDQLHYRHLIKKYGNEDEFVRGALKYVGLNNALDASLNYAVSVVGSKATYWKCVDILKNISGIDFSVSENAMETSIVNETETYIQEISPKIDLLYSKLSSLKKNITVTNVIEEPNCDLTNVKEVLKKIPRDKIFDLMKEICSD